MRVSLRTAIRSDLPLLLAWRADREVMEFLPSAPKNPTWEAIRNRSTDTRYHWIVEYGEGDDQRPVGEVVANASSGEVGIVLGEKSLWGKGVGRAAVREMIECLVADPTFKARPINAVIHPENHRSQRLFSSLGFVRTGKPARNGQEEWVWSGRFP